MSDGHFNVNVSVPPSRPVVEDAEVCSLDPFYNIIKKLAAPNIFPREVQLDVVRFQNLVEVLQQCVCHLRNETAPHEAYPPRTPSLSMEYDLDVIELSPINLAETFQSQMERIDLKDDFIAGAHLLSTLSSYWFIGE